MDREPETWEERCLFNSVIRCTAEDAPQCHRCGWCPTVEARRKFELRRRLGATIVTVREES